MDEGQQTFYNFVMQRVQAGKEEEIKAILDESFKKQQGGTFTPEYMAGIVPKMTALLKPECVEEFKQAAAHMRSRIK